MTGGLLAAWVADRDRSGPTVQVGSVEIREARLASNGVALSAALGELAVELDRTDDRVAGLPDDGWRVLAESAARTTQSARIPRRLTLGAPRRDATGGWALLTFNRHGDEWSAGGVDPGPVRPRPDKAARRAGLRLEWPESPVVVDRRDPGALRVVLRNVSDRPLGGPGDSDYAGDHATAVAGLHDLAGRALTRGGWWAGGEFPRIDAGGRVGLPAVLLTGGIDELPAGRCLIRAWIPSLGLRTRLHEAELG